MEFLVELADANLVQRITIHGARRLEQVVQWISERINVFGQCARVEHVLSRALIELEKKAGRRNNQDHTKRCHVLSPEILKDRILIIIDGPKNNAMNKLGRRQYGSGSPILIV